MIDYGNILHLTNTVYPENSNGVTMTSNQISENEELESYEKAISQILVGGSKKFELAANNHQVDDGVKGGVKEIKENPEFDMENNILSYEVEGSQGGDYNLLIDFTEKRVYHSHDNSGKSEVFVLDVK